MKLNVLGMGKYNYLPIFLLTGFMALSQARPEREHRILKSQFPTLVTDHLDLRTEIKKLRYFKTVDSTETTYTRKFKKDRLYYHIDYDGSGNLIGSGFRVKEVDIPSDTYAMIQQYLQGNYERYKIRRMWQLYPAGLSLPGEDALKNTFQNLIRPDNLYKVMVRDKSLGKRMDYELWFDATGGFKQMRYALPANHDRVLY
tara:strand:+ start:427 stop:1026 length:600 start_codon:yes stop_codon:yes gene_type:complete